MSFSMETGKVNKLSFLDVLQLQFIENELLAAYVVTLKVFYLQFINLVWYILYFIDVFLFAQIGHNSI